MTLTVGATGTITATVDPANATNKKVNWSSSNTDVATVANGVVTAKAPGTATITATSAADSSKKATVFVAVVNATFVSTGNVGIAPESAGEAAGKIYAEYKLVAGEGEYAEPISLAEGNVDYIKVKVGDGEWQDLTANTDATLWFNVEAETGLRTFEVKTKGEDAKVYVATLDWKDEIKTATWAATNREGIRPGTDNAYVEYKLMDGEKQVSLKVGEVKLIASKDEGKWVKLDPNTDSTLWFKKAKPSGNYEFFVVTSEGTMYKAPLAYTLQAKTATFEAVEESAGIHDGKIYQGYKLLDTENNNQINLIQDNIASISVLEPGATKAKPLTVEEGTDPLLWFNVQKTPGEYKYIIETKGDGAKIYEATLDWTAPTEVTAVKAEGEPAYNEERQETYQLYTVQVDVSPADSKVFQIKPDGTASELTVLKDDDNHLNIWFRLSGGEAGPQQEGDHVFLIKKGETWYKAVINYKAAEDPQVQAALAAVNEAGAYVSDDNHPMRAAVEANAAILGLATGEGTTYYGLVDGRKRAVNIDLYDNKPEGGYDLETLQATFNEIVATRLVFEQSVALFAAASADNPLTDLKYITMLIDNLGKVTYQKKHSGKSIEEVILPELNGLVNDFNALTNDQQTEVLKAIDYTKSSSSTATRNALRTALNKYIAYVSNADELTTALNNNVAIIKFKQDITLTNQVNITKDIVIDGQGKTLTGSDNLRAFSVQGDDIEVTIQNINFDTFRNGTTVYSVGKITIENNTYTNVHRCMDFDGGSDVTITGNVFNLGNGKRAVSYAIEATKEDIQNILNSNTFIGENDPDLKVRYYSGKWPGLYNVNNPIEAGEIKVDDALIVTVEHASGSPGEENNLGTITVTGEITDDALIAALKTEAKDFVDEITIKDNKVYIKSFDGKESCYYELIIETGTENGDG